MRFLNIFLILLGISASSSAVPDGSRILAGSIGNWSGNLYYLDYQSGRRFTIPMSVKAELTPDGATLMRRLEFTDPGRLAHAVNLSTIDRDSGKLVEAYFREGKAEFDTFDILQKRWNAGDDWTLVYEQDGSDDNRPARIRHMVNRTGDRMTSRKEVRFEGAADFVERNGSELTLVD